MLGEKILAAFKGDSKELEMESSDPGSTKIITRRAFLKTFIGTAAGFYFFGISLSNNHVKLVRQQPALVIADEVQPPHVSHHIINRPFINAFNHVVTPTYDRSDQSVHPSIIDFMTEYGINSWGGFRYWMAFTPYPNYNSAFENPSLLVSKDGLNWIDPPGIKNPLVSKPLGSYLGNYNSDPELVFDPDQDTLILYWREYYQDAYEEIWVKKISSNHTLRDKILCFKKTWDHQTGLMLSPTVWRKSAQEWYMWTTDGNVTMHLYTSADGITWSLGQPCSAPWNTWNGGYIPWHIGAKPNHLEQEIEFLISGWPNKGTIKDCQLLYATAPMSQPKELSMPLPGPLLGPGAGDQWDDGYIYRSSFVRETGDVPKFRIWYSACSKKKAWHIGYTEGNLG
ncbi:hypothetical protein [Desulfosporosinus sp. Sb-LF]|uniref:hypothetical protein n=1 Tax=Desulfosporosinus sp. Sb-LF TaxID=2560027 RepID=UPI00107F6027|nr:hypothetical protein [Desulfosporosinus sp. Sb-LF]TGE31417.1 hypothetical protein E4K68_17700 [Desulfosporosinus sp. Sb-LF]